MTAMKWFLIILLVFLSELCAFGFLASYEPGDHLLARMIYGLTGGAMVVTAVWLLTRQAGKSWTSVIAEAAGAVFGSCGASLALMELYHLGPRGSTTGFWAGVPYGIWGVPPGAILGAWLTGRIAVSFMVSNQLTLARTAILIMTIVPLLLWLAGLAATPGRSSDPIAVSTVFALFAMTPGAVIAVLLLWRFLPRSPPLLRSCSIAAVFSLAALVWVGDFWLIGIGAGAQVVMAEDVLVADRRFHPVDGIPMASELCRRSER